MGIRLAILILYLLFATAGPVLAQGSCLRCHPGHYQELGTCVACHRGEPRSVRPEIAHHMMIPGAFAHFMIPHSPVVEQGKKLLDQAACRRCHLSGGRGNRLAADLDRTIHQVAPRELEKSILEPVTIMPDFRLTTIQAAGLINALFAAGTKSAATEVEFPRKVHFQERTQHKDNAFANFCGPCHQVLTSRFGGLGVGSMGPNLSGLLTSFYPDTFRNNQPWTPDNLRKWLANPRESRTFALMPPLRLKENEQKSLLQIFMEPDISVGAAPAVPGP